MAAAEAPFKALRAAGDPKADAVYQLLKASRGAHTAGDFDTAFAVAGRANVLIFPDLDADIAFLALPPEWRLRLRRGPSRRSRDCHSRAVSSACPVPG